MEHKHDHDHSPAHSHSHEPSASLKNLVFAIVINGRIVAFEMVFGLLIQNSDPSAAPVFAPRRTGRPSRRAMAYGNAAEDGRNQVHDALRNGPGGLQTVRLLSIFLFLIQFYHLIQTIGGLHEREDCEKDSGLVNCVSL